MEKPVDEAKEQQLQAEWEAIAQQIHDVAESHRGDGAALLGLLRVLESLHREICNGVFQETLPKTRHELYSLLKDIEAEGGWPYIGRMRLRHFLSYLEEVEDGS
ncbi:hypothetical protein [Vacuolonema iberomarrocanum]|uniref:hypothetical protein n=1 Tax=Vacuolonema iberomarrocanum TaxID=3454632 RepID=UPI0019D9CF0E|nr:hypothetical protein [filamentous cyanobacterium LEGE 07170]